MFLLAPRSGHILQCASFLRRIPRAALCESLDAGLLGAHTARRKVHVEAHLNKLGIELPKAIVPPQGKLSLMDRITELLGCRRPSEKNMLRVCLCLAAGSPACRVAVHSRVVPSTVYTQCEASAFLAHWDINPVSGSAYWCTRVDFLPCKGLD